MRIVRRPLAQADVDEIWFYIAASDQSAATRMIERIAKATERLVDFPRSGRPHSNIRSGLRSVSAPPYVIFYHVDDDRVEILRVIHGARDFDSLRLFEDV